MYVLAGLISAAPGRRNAALQQSAKQVENMVRNKMEQREYIILCLEDSNDWSNATSRRLVMQVRAARHLLTVSGIDRRHVPKLATYAP